MFQESKYVDPGEERKACIPKPVSLPEGYFEVERILDKRTKGKATYYLVQWAGYPDSENTWEPKTNLKNIKHMIEDFEKSQT